MLYRPVCGPKSERILRLAPARNIAGPFPEVNPYKTRKAQMLLDDQSW